MILKDTQTKFIQKLCVSVSLKDLESAKLAAATYDFLEYRLEEDFYPIQVLEYFFSKNNNKIACLSTLDNPEVISEYVFYALKFGVDIIDVNYTLDSDLIKEIRINTAKKNKKLLVSYHNFENYPGLNIIRDIYDRICEYNPNFIKLVCQSNDTEAINELSSLNENPRNNNKLICFGMGEKVKFSRIDSLIKGAPFTYVYPDFAQATAPGQYSYSQAIKTITETFHGA